MARNGHNVHSESRGEHLTETPDVSHIKNIDVTHEASDVSVNALMKFVGALTVMTALVAVLMLGLFKFFQSQEEKKESPPGPMAMTKEERLPPEPRLQGAKGFQVKLENGQVVDLELSQPEAEYRVLLQQWERQLNCKNGDSAPTIQCVPIGEAMERVVKEQLLRSRVEKVPEDGSGRLVDYGTDIPTAASSGRMTMKGK